MKKIKVGIPKSLHYYYYSNLWKYFFQELGIETVESINTNKNIVNEGINKACDEMCLSLKIYLGHVDYLKDKCDYILVPRIDNYGLKDQTCTNFLALYDIVNNLFNVNILNYNVDLEHKDTELKGFINIGSCLGINRKKTIMAYKNAVIKNNKLKKQETIKTLNKLKSNKNKIMVISHPYNINDSYIGLPIIKMLNNFDCEIIHCDKLDTIKTNKLSSNLSNTLYWKYSKENIGALELMKDSIDGVILLSTFPCGLDSLVNELVIRKINIPYINLIIDDIDSLTGIETRIESFIDIINQRNILV